VDRRRTRARRIPTGRGLSAARGLGGDLVAEEKGRAFGDWLIEELRARRMSQRQLAARSGVHHSTICRLTRGDRVPSLATATKLAQVFGTSGGPRPGPALVVADAAPRDAVAGVEHALRSDRSLSEAQVRRVMRYYLGERRAAVARRLPVQLVRASQMAGQAEAG
jgi:transcriptional regulator with XRE-family HTH domain